MRIRYLLFLFAASCAIAFTGDAPYRSMFCFLVGLFGPDVFHDRMRK